VIVTARKLANASPKKPRQADLKRSISTSYYALFHAMAKDASDMLVGVGPDRPDKAWTHTYRALQHGDAKSACKEVRNLNFPDTIKSCADSFVTLQQKRHDADYDPDCRVLRADALEAIQEAEDAIRNLKTSPKRDRRAFAVQILMKKRKT
jgi:uncharacterized protein (UPF0332 family)